MGGVAVNPVSASRRNHAHLGHRGRRLTGSLGQPHQFSVFFDVHVRMAHLHRAGMGPQVAMDAVVALDVDVKRVLHRARRVVGRVVQRGEAVPVALDLGAIGHIKTHAGENLLDALHREADRMQTTLTPPAPGQAHVQRF